MPRSKVTPILIDPAMQARCKFSTHVQSIAFNLTLSRRMIDLLQAVRDYGFPHLGHEGDPKDWEEWSRNRSVCDYGNGSHQYVAMVNALERRGLVLFDARPWQERRRGDKSVRLSRAGELVCALLIEAGLMAAAPVPKRKKA